MSKPESVDDLADPAVFTISSVFLRRVQFRHRNGDSWEMGLGPDSDSLDYQTFIIIYLKDQKKEVTVVAGDAHTRELMQKQPKVVSEMTLSYTGEVHGMPRYNLIDYQVLRIVPRS